MAADPKCFRCGAPFPRPAHLRPGHAPALCTKCDPVGRTLVGVEFFGERSPVCPQCGGEMRESDRGLVECFPCPGLAEASDQMAARVGRAAAGLVTIQEAADAARQLGRCGFPNADTFCTREEGHTGSIVVWGFR